jgi:glycosyltransferase involved in cell wall biosynthesis
MRKKEYIHIHALHPNLPGQNKLIEWIEHFFIPLSLLKTTLKLNNRADTDILVIHKTLQGEPIEYITGVNVAERLLTRFDNVVYSTYDADYTHSPDKANYLFNRSDLVLATSKAIVQEARKFKPPEEIAYIPPSVDTEFFQPRRNVPDELASDSLVLGWIGDADSHKQNLHFLSRCLSGLNRQDITLRLLLGGSSISQSLKSQFEATGVNIDIIKYVPRERVPKVINSFDIGLAPLQDTVFNRGRSSEKIREYMSCGVPVIASNVGENPHLVPENTGILAEGKEEWLDAITTLQSTTKRKIMGSRARLHMENSYAIPVVSKEIKHAIDSIVG